MAASGDPEIGGSDPKQGYVFCAATKRRVNGHRLGRNGTGLDWKPVLGSETLFGATVGTWDDDSEDESEEQTHRQRNVELPVERDSVLAVAVQQDQERARSRKLDEWDMMLDLGKQKKVTWPLS